MSNETNSSMCRMVCWIIAAVSGLLALYLVTGAVSFIAALLLAIALAVFLGLVLIQLFCRYGETASHDEDMSDTPTAAATAPAASTATSAAAGSAAKDAGDATSGQAAAAAADDSAAASAAETEIAAKTPETGASDNAASEAESTPDYDNDGVREGTNEGTRPEALDGPRGGQADNLKEIKGVGPKLEQLLHELGFYHFDQVAAWTADEVAWVDANLKGFKGRVSRDGWVEQAKILAAGGETEFSKRVEDGDVY